MAASRTQISQYVLLRAAWQVASLVLGLSSQGACAQLYAKPVTTPLQPYEMSGYQILPPTGENWFEMRRDQRTVYFGKRIASPTHSLVAIALSAPLEEGFNSHESFRRHVEKQLRHNAGDGRHVISAVAVQREALAGSLCVRYQTRGEDRQAAQAQGRLLVVETVGLSCLDRSGKFVVDASYTERGLPAELGGLLQDEGEMFIRGLKPIPSR